jgi:hypothetical protein
LCLELTVNTSRVGACQEGQKLKQPHHQTVAIKLLVLKSLLLAISSCINTIDYRCEDRSKLVCRETTLVPLEVLTPSLEIPDHHSTKKRIVQPEDTFEDIAFKPGGLEFSNSLPGCRESALHFFVK